MKDNKDIRHSKIEHSLGNILSQDHKFFCRLYYLDSLS